MLLLAHFCWYACISLHSFKASAKQTNLPPHGLYCPVTSLRNCDSSNRATHRSFLEDDLVRRLGKQKNEAMDNFAVHLNLQAANADKFDALSTFSDSPRPQNAVLQASESDEGSSRHKRETSVHTSPERQKKRPRRCDPNRARSARRREALELKCEVSALTKLRDSLNGRMGDQKGELVRLFARSKCGGPAASVWEETMNSQLSQRIRAEAENVRLRNALLTLDNLSSRLLQSSTRSLQMMQGVDCKLSGRIQSLLLDSATDVQRFQLLLQVVESLHIEMDAVFRLNGLAECSNEPRSGVELHEGDQGSCLDMFANSVLPFPLDSTAKTIWEFFSGPAKHRGQLYFKTTKTVSTTHTTMIEKFALEQHVNNSRVDFRFWQVLRRHVEHNRMLVVWFNIAEPVEFTHKRVSSCGYVQKGFVSCERLTDLFTRLRRCYRVTPCLSNEISASNMKRETSAILEWILQLDAVDTHLRYFESELLKQSLNKRDDNVSIESLEKMPDNADLKEPSVVNDASV